jgi:hypothetical protein
LPHQPCNQSTPRGLCCAPWTSTAQEPDKLDLFFTVQEKELAGVSLAG